MKTAYTLLLALFLLVLTSCKEDKLDDPAPKPNPVAEKLVGLWERGDSKWQYFDEDGTEKEGLPGGYSIISKYGFNSYGGVRITFRDGSGGPDNYELTDRDGEPYIKLPDGYGLITVTDYHIESIKDSSMVLVATYSDFNYKESIVSDEVLAKRAVNTVTLLRK